MEKRVSLKKIAKLVGVSKVVVYTVLNKRENKGIFVSKKTKEKILKIANELGYVSPKSAKELFSGKSDTIGIIFHKLTPFFSQLVSAIQQEALKHGFEITPYITGGDSNIEEHYLNLCRDGRVDGIITVAHTDRSIELYKKYTQKPYNLKILSYGPPIEEIPTVGFNEEKAGQLVSAHLMEIGCKSFAYFGGEKNSKRCKGFIDYLKENKYKSVIWTGERLIPHQLFVGYYNDGIKLAKKFFETDNKIPEGIFASNDILGAILLKETIKRGFKIPEQIAIVGCDNSEICLYTEPELTSIDVNINDTAKKLIETMKKIINGEELKTLHIKIPVNLVKRGSTVKI
jgi:LacI family transcriptional regulator